MGAVGKVAVVGAKDRATKRVTAKVVAETDKVTLQGFVSEVVARVQRSTRTKLPHIRECPLITRR